MSWNETCIMEERMRFVVACLEGLESERKDDAVAVLKAAVAKYKSRLSG